MSEYDRQMANRKPNPEMRDCQFCGKRFAKGQPCCTPQMLWDSRSDGPAMSVTVAGAGGKERKGFVPLTADNRRRYPLCGPWRRHLGNPCRRCGHDRKAA
jgi:hypothetical protein